MPCKPNLLSPTLDPKQRQVQPANWTAICSSNGLAWQWFRLDKVPGARPQLWGSGRASVRPWQSRPSKSGSDQPVQPIVGHAFFEQAFQSGIQSFSFPRLPSKPTTSINGGSIGETHPVWLLCSAIPSSDNRPTGGPIFLLSSCITQVKPH